MVLNHTHLLILSHTPSENARFVVLHSHVVEPDHSPSSWQVRLVSPISVKPGLQVVMPVAPTRCSFSCAGGMYMTMPFATT